jgi:anti-sigma regulatory factor (Ser/Thr protein kinase)
MTEGAEVLKLGRRIGELERLAHWIEEFGARHVVDHRVITDVELAVDELVTNPVTYGWSDDAPHEIHVCQRLEADDWIVEIEDDGRAFDPRSVPTPPLDAPLEQRPIGGLGIHLVRSVVDELGYRREAGRNHVTLRKRVRRHDPPSAAHT